MPLPSSLGTTPLNLGAPPTDGAPPIAAAGIATGKTLSFETIHQETEEWCWAAVAAAIGNYYGPDTWKQCKVVEDQFKLAGRCCGDTPDSDCVKPGLLRSALADMEYIGPLAASSSATDIETEIAHDHPLCMEIQWQGGGYHFVTIIGINQDRTRIVVADPYYGNSVVDVAHFPEVYQGGGSWYVSIETQPRQPGGVT